jgi:acetyl-CoA synthetase
MIVSVADPELCGHIDEAHKSVTSLAVKATVGGRRPGWASFEEGVAAASPVFARPTGKDATKNSDLMLLYFTSGTTGMPKMVVHDNTYPLGHILTARVWHNLDEESLHITVADTGWAKAAWGKIYGQWLCGAALFVYDMDKFVPRELLEKVTKYGVTGFCAPPTVFRFFIKEDLSRYDFSKMKWCTVAGEPLNPEVYQQWLKATGIRLLEGYGQTETVVALGTWPWVTPRPGSMGKPSPLYEVDVVDEAARSCEVGEVGQIVIRTGYPGSPRPLGMFLGYHRDPELTGRAWHDGLYYTGDTAWRDEDGYYWFVGRADDLIKSSGYRIGPFEVESALLEHPAVLECAVTGAPDPVRGQVVKATVVLVKGREPSDKLVEELQEHVKKVTAPYKYPRIVEFVPELPKTISGKIRRVEIRDKDKTIE